MSSESTFDLCLFPFSWRFVSRQIKEAQQSVKAPGGDSAHPTCSTSNSPHDHREKSLWRNLISSSVTLRLRKLSLSFSFLSQICLIITEQLQLLWSLIWHIITWVTHPFVSSKWALKTNYDFDFHPWGDLFCHIPPGSEVSKHSELHNHATSCVALSW